MENFLLRWLRAATSSIANSVIKHILNFHLQAKGDPKEFTFKIHRNYSALAFSDQIKRNYSPLDRCFNPLAFVDIDLNNFELLFFQLNS